MTKEKNFKHMETVISFIKLRIVRGKFHTKPMNVTEYYHEFREYLKLDKMNKNDVISKFKGEDIFVHEIKRYLFEIAINECYKNNYFERHNGIYYRLDSTGRMIFKMKI